jgi:hypothetical protein
VLAARLASVEYLRREPEMKQLHRQQRRRRPESRKSASWPLQSAGQKTHYCYVTEIDSVDGRTDYRFFENLETAENLYYRAFCAARQKMPVVEDSGRKVRLVRCRLFRVDGDDLQSAKEQITNNMAARLLDSDDLLGDGVKIDALFRVLH